MKLFNFLNESFQHYTVKHKPSGKTYKVTSMSQADAKTKAAVQHGGRSASRFSGTSDDQFEIVEGKIKDIVKALKGPGYYSLDKDNPDHPADISDKLRKKLSQKDEGKSPHKKGTAKYKKHMAAMHAEEVEVDEVAGPKDCWDGYKKDGTQPGTGKNKGKRVNKCVKEDEVDTGPTWKDDLEDALDGYPEWAHEYIKDGVCPECGGNGYMDGDYEDENGEENEECNGMYNYDCDEGEIRDNTWADELKSKEPEEPKQPAPSKEQIMKLLPMLHKEYVQSGRYNAFELGGILKQMYPELNKRLAGSYVADFFKTFEEGAELRKLAGLEEDGVKPHKMYKDDKVVMAKDEDDHNRLTKQGYTHDNPKTKKIEEDDSDDVVVAKMLSKALGDPNRWMEMSPPELYAELESTNPESADMIAKVAKMLYDVRLQERTYKDVGVADVQKDARGKEFKFDKDAKQFKSGDGELADIKTKVGKDLMKKRKLAMKKSTPSYNKKSAPKKKGFIASLFNDLEG